MKKSKNRAFTLAEVMIVLTVIGILSAILLPVAWQSTPDKNVLKLKKGYNTLTSVIRELVSSDKYHLNGDLGKKPDGSLITSNAANHSYFCKSIADIVSVKTVNCDITDISAANAGINYIESTESTSYIYNNGLNGSPGPSPATILVKKQTLDTACNNSLSSDAHSQIITTDDISFWDPNQNATFGINLTTTTKRLFSAPNEPPTVYDANGFDVVYKTFCMDIDGVPNGASKDDCINECPFGFGIRADGKILTGARADEWLKKEITNKD